MLNRKDLLKSKNLLVKKLAQTNDFCLLPTGSPAVFYADIARMDQRNKELEEESKKPIAQVVVKIDADNPMVLGESTTHERLLEKITTSYVRNKPKDVSEDEARRRAEEDLSLIERSIAQLEMNPVSHYLLGSLRERDPNVSKADRQKQKVTISFSYSGVTVETEEENFDVELATGKKLYTLLGKTKTCFDVENYSAEQSHARAIAQAKAELARFDEILKRNPTTYAKKGKEEEQAKLKSLEAQSPEEAGFKRTRVLRLRYIDAINRTQSIPVLLMQFKAPPHKYRDTAAFWWIAGLAAGLIGVGLLFVAPIACFILLTVTSVFAAKGWYEDRKNARHVEDRVMPRQALPPVDSDMVSAGAGGTHADLIRHQRLQEGERLFQQAARRGLPKKSLSVDNSAAAASQPEQPVESKAMLPDQSDQPVESKATPPDHSENFRPRSPSK